MPESSGTPKEHFGAEEIVTRGRYLRETLADGRYSIKDLLYIREALNGLLTDGRFTHSKWIKKPQRAEDAADEDYRLVLASRIAPGLAKLKWLDYMHVTDEDDLEVPHISLVQAGYPMLATVDECYEFFDKKALHPIQGEKDVPSPGKERPCPRRLMEC